MPFVATIVNWSGSDKLCERSVIPLFADTPRKWEAEECELCECGSEALRSKANRDKLNLFKKADIQAFYKLLIPTVMKKQKTNINARYKIKQTFEYNRKHGPYEKVQNKNGKIKKVLGDYGIDVDFFGFKTKLPIGVAAGTLHSLAYMEASMRDGFEVLTWKTFRSEHRLAHRNDGNYLGHNIVFVPNDTIAKKEIGTDRTATLSYNGAPEEVSITNSVGMPSPAPVEWMPEVLAGQKLAEKYNKSIITSVVGTAHDGDTVKDLARDYAFVARAAESVGEKIIELNLSCPNVKGKEGVIYKDIKSSKIIAQTVREHLRNEDTKLLLKLGYADKVFYKRFLNVTAPFVDGIVAINTISMNVRSKDGTQALPGGLSSGTCGAAILERATEAVSSLVQARKELGIKKSELKIIGCGGVTDPESFIAHIKAGAEFVMCATASLFNPDLPLQIAKYLKENKIKRRI